MHLRNENFERQMMNKVIVTGLALAIAGTAAAEEINQTMDVSSTPRIDISNTAGDIDVEGWSRNQIEVTGELGSGVDEFIFEKNGNDRVTIKVKLRRNHSHSGGTDLEIKAPVGSSINVNGVSTDITVSGIEGEQSLQSVSGDVESEVFAQDVEVSSVSGDVELQGDGKGMRTSINSVSGDVDLHNLAGEIEATSVSGDLAIANGSFERAQLNTTNGDLVFHSGLADDGRMQMDTVNGEVEIEFKGKVSATFDISTFNGDIDNCFGPEPQRSNKYGPGYELHFTEGDGDSRVSINTLNGDVRLCKD